MSARSGALRAWMRARVPVLGAGAALLCGAAFMPGARLAAQQAVVNTASVTYETIGGTDSVISNPVQTIVTRPQALLQKSLIGATIAKLGDHVQYRIDYGNGAAAGSIAGAVLTDTLPTGLEYVASQPSATVLGRVLQWSLGDLAPGAAGQVQLTLAVSAAVTDTQLVRNRAYLVATNAASQIALAPALQLVGPPSRALGLSKAADALEVGLGETAPFTLTVTNAGTLPLTDVRVVDRLPVGSRFAAGSMTGADSARAEGQVVTFFVAGPLAPGAARRIRYAAAIVSASAEVVWNTAVASAEAGAVSSAEASAFVRLRRTDAMATRAAIGKVWLDRNGNGAQDADDPGVPGVDVWTPDGEVATSDAQGRFSYRNLRAGRHGFRLDPSSLAPEVGIADDATGAGFVVRDATGWTTPRADFRLLSRAATVADVELPLTWRMTAVATPRMPDSLLSVVAPTPAAIDVHPVSASPTAPGTPIDISANDTDSAATEARTPRIAKGDDGGDVRPRQRAMPPRADSALAAPIAYQFVLGNPSSVALDPMTLRFDAPLDSARVQLGDSVLGAARGAWVAIPSIPAHGTIAVHAWTRAELDSSRVSIGPASSDGAAFAGGPLATLGEGLRAHAHLVPLPDSLAAAGTVRVRLAPPESGWPGEAVWRLPAGWDVVPGSAHAGSAVIADPAAGEMRADGRVLRWVHLAAVRDTLSLELRAAAALAPAEVVRVPPLGSAGAKEMEARRSLTAGPGIEFFAPLDGTVLRADRLFVGVRGEPNAPVALLDGDSVIAEGRIRIDGVHDFIAVQLAPGPHHLRARVANSWQQERWDSIAVHVTGAPARFAAQDSTVTLVADGHSERVVRIRVLDRWGVPVVNGPFVTVTATGATPTSADADASSVGLQRQADAAGWITVALRSGTQVRPGRLSLSSGAARTDVRLDMLPSVGPLFLTGVGQVGVGAAPGAFGSLTARGRLDARTSITASYDSRRLDQGRPDFGRSFDPLAEAQYPILGDAGQFRSVGASRYQLSARIERGYDWLAYGDVSTTGFAEGLRLNAYQRALPGAAGRYTAGPLQLRGFFSTTTQSVQQLQLRGQGTSGPYALSTDVAPGTEQVRLESRDAANPERIVTQQVLTRFVDYQVDYQSGTLLLKQPVPAADTYGNPVFILVNFETNSGGPRHDTWGLRAVGDAGRLLGRGVADSLTIGATMVNDGAGNGARSLSGFDMQLRQGRSLALRAEVSRATGSDSTGIAASVDGSFELLQGALRLTGGWMRVGDEYRNPANFALVPGSEEFRIGSRYRTGFADITLEHEVQRFGANGVSRRRTASGLKRALGRFWKVEAQFTDEFAEAGGRTDGSLQGESRLTWTPLPQLDVWADGRRQLSSTGSLIRPDYVGVGASWRVQPSVSLEARERLVMLPGTGTDYMVTNVGVRAHVAAGTEAWSSYQLAGVDGRYNSAIIGLGQRLKVGDRWALNALLERRSGVSNASLIDPVRAAPFLQPEDNYWTVGLGAELLPKNVPYRLSARGELRNGTLRSSRLLSVAGDASLTPSLAVLSRQEFVYGEQRPSGLPLTSRQYNSLWAVALRPAQSNHLNMLGKFQWIRATNPGGAGVLTGTGDENRVIGAIEGIWSPRGPSEFALRYALRRTTGAIASPDSLTSTLRSAASFIGWRARQDVTTRFGVRADGRLLLEQTSGTSRWDIAPQLYILPVPVLEVATGYRIGNLRDPDFAVDGGQGWFLTFGVRLTEESLLNPAAFWRNRLGAQR